MQTRRAAKQSSKDERRCPPRRCHIINSLPSLHKRPCGSRSKTRPEHPTCWRPCRYGTQNSSTAKARYMIQNTIQHVSDWANSWALNINKSKTVSTLFSLSTSKENVKLTLGQSPSTTSRNTHLPWNHIWLATLMENTHRDNWKNSIQERHTWKNLQVQDGVLTEKSFTKSILVPYAQSWNMHLLPGSPPPKPPKPK